jgi:branched-chain amino acid transport system substrate-binding protein
MARLGRGPFIAGAAAAGVVAASRPARATFGDTPLAGTVTIGVIGPFTGDMIRFGEQMGNGVRAATDDANQLRGPLDKAFAMQTFDDQNLLASGLVNAQFTCDDPQIVAVIGHLSGRITEAAMHTYVTNEMQVICPASSYDRLTSHGYGNLLRLETKDSVQGHLAARYMNASVKPKSVVAIYQDGDYGPDVVTGFVAQMQGDKVKTTPIELDLDKPDFDAAAKATIAAKPDAVFLAGKVSDIGTMLPTLQVNGYTGPLHASQGFFDAPTTTTYAAYSEGLTISSSMPPLALAPGAFQIKNDFERKYGPMTPLSAFTYAAAQIVIAVTRRTAANDRVAVERALNVSTAFDTIIGTVSFQNDGDPLNPNAYFYTVKNGAWKYVASAIPSNYIVK